MLMQVADEVWLATAMLHRESPQREDFTMQEIKEMAAKAQLPGRLRAGFAQYISRHCVANKPADPGKYRMLFGTRRGWRRLFREGDEIREHESRKGGKRRPEVEGLPEKYRELITWYEQTYYPRKQQVSHAEVADSRELAKELVLRVMSMTPPQLHRLKAHLDSEKAASR
jgi:hypothetical protein